MKYVFTFGMIDVTDSQEDSKKCVIRNFEFTGR